MRKQISWELEVSIMLNWNGRLISITLFNYIIFLLYYFLYHIFKFVFSLNFEHIISSVIQELSHSQKSDAVKKSLAEEEMKKALSRIGKTKANPLAETVAYRAKTLEQYRSIFFCCIFCVVSFTQYFIYFIYIYILFASILSFFHIHFSLKITLLVILFFLSFSIPIIQIQFILFPLLSLSLYPSLPHTHQP